MKRIVVLVAAILVVLIMVGLQACRDDFPISVDVDVTADHYRPTRFDAKVSIAYGALFGKEVEGVVDGLFADLTRILRLIEDGKKIQMISVTNEYDPAVGSKSLRLIFLTENLISPLAQPRETRYLSIVHSQNRLTFKIYLPFLESGKEWMSSRPDDEKLAQFLKKVGWKSGIRVTVKFPWRVMDANGKVSEDGHAVTWNIDYVDPQKEKATIWVSFELEKNDWINLRSAYKDKTPRFGELQTFSLLMSDCTAVPLPDFSKLSDGDAEKALRSELEKVLARLYGSYTLDIFTQDLTVSLYRAHSHLPYLILGRAFYEAWMGFQGPMFEVIKVFLPGCKRRLNDIRELGVARFGGDWYDQAYGSILSDPKFVHPAVKAYMDRPTK